MSCVSAEYAHVASANGICVACGQEVTSLKADLDARIPQPGDALTQEEGDLLHPDSVVRDVDRDLWRKLPSGEWTWQYATVSTATLFNIFQPVTLMESST